MLIFGIWLILNKNNKYEMNACEILKQKGFNYNKITGEITSPEGNVMNGKTLGYIMINTRVDSKIITTQAHRFAFYCMTGRLPNGCIDHINMNRSDNRWENLREVTHQENCFNTNAKGYYFNKDVGKYQSQIIINKENIYLGLHETEEEAHNAYLEAKKVYHVIENSEVDLYWDEDLKEWIFTDEIKKII